MLTEGRSLPLADAERAAVNAVLEKYITLGPGIVENVGWQPIPKEETCLKRKSMRYLWIALLLIVIAVTYKQTIDASERRTPLGKSIDYP